MVIFNHRFSIYNFWQLRRTIVEVLSKITRLRNFFIVFLSLLLRKTKIKGDPIILMIEPSSRCNLECPMCPRQLNKMKRYEVDMSFEHYKMIVDELCDTLMFLSLWNFGEPLLNNKIIEMIKYAKMKRIAVALSTNAVLFTNDKISELLDSGVDLLVVPLDGATKSTYEKYRKNAIFEHTLENINSLVRRKKELNKHTPLIDLQFIVMKGNEHEISLFKKLAEQLEVDIFTLKKAVFIREERADFFPQNDYLVCDCYLKKIDAVHCNRVYVSSVINSNGDVVPCCFDTTFQYIMGNVFNGNRFREIWNNVKYRDFRKKAYGSIKDVDICQNCPGASFNAKVYV